MAASRPFDCDFAGHCGWDGSSPVVKAFVYYTSLRGRVSGSADRWNIVYIVFFLFSV